MATRLSLLPFLQAWDGVALSVRLLAVPRGRPLDPLVEGKPGPSFATAHLVVAARLVPGLDSMATTASAAADVTIDLPVPAQSSALLQELETEFRVPPSSPPHPRPSGVEIRKFAPRTYRSAAGFSASRTSLVVTDDSFHCAMRSSRSGSYKGLPPPTLSGIPWGNVLAFALRQPALAEALGLVRPMVARLPSS